MKAGRNDPCPCNSGKKFKKCHLGRESELPAPATAASNEPPLRNASAAQDSYCPYHNHTHPLGTIFTDEHVLPYSLGGSNELKIRICKAANDRTGSEVDAPLINNIFTTTQRISRNIKGYGDSEPKLILQGNVHLGDAKIQAKNTITSTGQTVWTKPSITRTQEKEQELIRIECDPEQLPGIIGDINRKLKKQGRTEIQIDEKTIKSQTVKYDSPKMEIDGAFDATSFHRGFVKMALGLAHFVLGESYSRSKDADLLRSFIWEPDPSKREKIPLPGWIWPTPDRTAEILKFKDWHVLAILNINPAVFYGILFGEFHGGVRLSAGIQTSANAPPPGDGLVFLINPETRAMHRMRYGEYLHRKSKELSL